MYVAIRFIKWFYISSHQWCFQGQNVAHLTATSTPVWRYRYRYSRSKDITYKGCNVAICTDLGTRARHKTKFLIRPIAFKRELGKYGVQGYNGCNPARVSRNGGRQYQVRLVYFYYNFTDLLLFLKQYFLLGKGGASYIKQLVPEI